MGETWVAGFKDVAGGRADNQNRNIEKGPRSPRKRGNNCVPCLMRSRIYPRLFFSPLLIRILACHTIFGAPQAPVLRVPAAQMPPAGRGLALPTPWDCGRAKRHTAPLLRRSAPRPNHGARCSVERKSDPGAPKRCGMWKIAPHLKQPISVVFLFFVCFSLLFS